MGSIEQNGVHPRTSAHPQGLAASGTGAKLVVADWPEGFGHRIYSTLSTLGRAAGWCLSVGEQTIHGEQIAGAAGITPLQQLWAERLDRGSWPTLELRIGLRPGHELSRRVRDAAGSGGVRFVEVREPVGDRAACASMNLDAMLVATPMGIKVQTREHRELEAGWFDWGSARPLSYPSVFPTRLDCAQVTIDDAPVQEDEVTLIRALAEAAAALSRVRARLTPADRWRGRKGIDDQGVIDEAMERLASALLRASLREIRSPQRAAARVLSAWTIREQHGPLGARERQLAELCARCAGQEAEIMLRLGAARLADMDDQGGRQALLAADRMLRTKPTLPGVDNSAFVQAELDQGRHDPRTVGRVAAGVVLACATLAVEKLVFSQGDLLDEMRFSEWLIGCDQDRSLLHHLTRELVWQRRAEQKGLPAGAAATATTTDSQTTPAETPAKRRGKAKAKPRAKSMTRAKAGTKSRAKASAAPTTPKPGTARSSKITTASETTPARKRKAA